MNTQNSAVSKKKMNKALKILLWIIGIILLLAATALTAYFCLKASGRKKLLMPSDTVLTVNTDFADSVEDDGKTIYYNGEKYILNENITSVLGMGIDKINIDKTDEEYGKNGQADCIFLIAIDTATGKTTAINISRETMVDIDVYSESGQYAGTQKKQICLAYAYGDGKEASCENVVKAASRYIYGLPINSYFCFDFEAVGTVNDYLGGITVISPEDIEFSDGTSVKAGEAITLHGNQALKYVRTRGNDIEANNRRMSRQTRYVKALAKKIIDRTKKNITVPVSIMNTVSDNLVTNIDASKVTYLADCFVAKNKTAEIEFKSVSGEVSMGEKYVEFHENQEELFKLILEIYYSKAE